MKFDEREFSGMNGKGVALEKVDTEV